MEEKIKAVLSNMKTNTEEREAIEYALSAIRTLKRVREVRQTAPNFVEFYDGANSAICAFMDKWQTE